MQVIDAFHALQHLKFLARSESKVREEVRNIDVCVIVLAYLVVKVSSLNRHNLGDQLAKLHLISQLWVNIEGFEKEAEAVRVN